MKPLKGIKVLDLSRVLAGPLCAQTLGDLGAEVIKVETPVSGDESRSWPPFHKGTATAYLTANRNKKSVALNLKDLEGQRILHRLVADADVVIESWATGVSKRLGADYETLSEINDRLIYCTISGFGRSGPLSELKGYDMILQAYSGMMSVTGDEKSSAVRIPFSPIDQATGYHAVIGVLSAVIERAASGRGSLVEVSLFETAVSFLGYMIQAYLEDGKLPTRSGSRHNGIAPYQAFECADRTVLIGVANDKLWRAFCAAFDAPELASDPRFITNKDRVRHRDEVVAAVQDIVKDKSAATLLSTLERIGVPCAPINSLRDVIDSPQAIERGLLRTIDGSDNPTSMLAVVMPILFNDRKRDLGTQPPALGEHTNVVLENLGYSADEIDELERIGVVARDHAPAHI